MTIYRVSVIYCLKKMAAKKKLTIGVTVNLEHYENLRLEVEGEAETREDAREIISYLDSVLSKLGRNDPDTLEKIESYRRRVLAVPEVFTAEETLAEEMKPTFAPEEPTMTPGSADIKYPETRPEKPPVVAEGSVCNECGAPISEQEEKLSMLFMSRHLCKSCMDHLQK